VVTEEDLNVDTSLALRGSTMSFKETGDTLAALRAFVVAHEAGLYPPLWALEWLVKGLKEYHCSNGKRSLDQLLGFTGGKGQAPVYKKAFVNDRNEDLCLHIFRLNRFAGYTVKQAARMVAAWLNRTRDWDKTGLRLRAPTAGTLEKEYSAKWRGLFEKMFDGLTEKMAEDFERNREGYLKAFRQRASNPRSRSR
jgi:hypothetical protein